MTERLRFLKIVNDWTTVFANYIFLDFRGSSYYVIYVLIIQVKMSAIFQYAVTAINI